MPEITLGQAVDIIARDFIASYVRNGDGWGDYPEVGEYDWDEIQSRAERLVEEPSVEDVEMAKAFLAARVEACEAPDAR